MKRLLFLLLACLALCGSVHAQQGNVVAVGGTPNTQFVTAVNQWYYDSTVPGDYPSIAPHWVQVKGGSSGGSGSSTPTPATLENKAAASVTTTSGTALAANASRKNASIKNEGTVQVTLGLAGAAVAGQGITLEPKQAYTIDSTNLYQGAITAIVASGTSTLSIHEGY